MSLWFLAITLLVTIMHSGSQQLPIRMQLLQFSNGEKNQEKPVSSRAILSNRQSSEFIPFGQIT